MSINVYFLVVYLKIFFFCPGNLDTGPATLPVPILFEQLQLPPLSLLSLKLVLSLLKLVLSLLPRLQLPETAEMKKRNRGLQKIFFFLSLCFITKIFCFLYPLAKIK